MVPSPIWLVNVRLVVFIILDMINIFSVQILSSVKFGELDLPLSTVYILIAISAFVFLGVGISSIQLVRSALENKDE